MENNEVFYVYLTHLTDGNPKQRYVGSYMLEDGEYRLLEDLTGWLDKAVPEGAASDPKNQRKLAKLSHSSMLCIIPKSEVDAGEHTAMLEQQRVDTTTAPEPMDKPPELYDYQHESMTSPVSLRVAGKNTYLNDKLLTRGEVAQIMAHIANKRATIRFQQAAPLVGKIQKAERAISVLLKGEDAPHENDERFQARGLDGVGNKYSALKYFSNNPGGTHVHISLADEDGIHYNHPPDVADHAALSLGKAIADKAKYAKVFRLGHTHYAAAFDNYTEASQFVRELSDHLDTYPPIGGTHAYSAAIGIGDHYERAHDAMHTARQARESGGFPDGKAPHHVYCSIPEYNGLVPVSQPRI